MNFASVKSLTIPEGKVKLITRKSDGAVLWKGGYTNLLPLATDADRKTIYGGDYNGDGKNDGYKTNTRLSSSGGGPTIASGMCASGFVPAKVGDILRIKGTTPKTGTNSYIMTFDSSNKMVKACSMLQSGGRWTTQAESTLTPDWQEYDIATDVLTVTLSSDYFGTGWDAVRFSAGVISADTIVTINEEITT